MIDKTELEAVVRFYNLGETITAARNSKGIVNLTYVVETNKGKYIIQKLNSIFDERVIMDHHYVEQHLRENGFVTPRLVQTPSGSYFMRKNGALWKVCKYIDHDPTATRTDKLIQSAAALLARFHRVMKECRYAPGFSIPDFHNTYRIMQKLERVYGDHARLKEWKEVGDVYGRIIAGIKRHLWSGTPGGRLIHGDPKFDNFLFNKGKAVAIIDFDTVMNSSPLVDIGDGLRSWCRKNGSDFDRALFRLAVNAYNTEARERVSHDEALNATALISLELAARFLTDSFEESYFEWDKVKYKTAAEHNLVRAREFVAYYQNIVGK